MIVETVGAAESAIEPPRVIAAQLILIDTVVYQGSCGQPVGIDRRRARLLESDAEPFEQRLLATRDWHELTWGWVSAPGLAVIDADAGNAHALEIGFDGASAPLTVRPGEVQRLALARGARVFIRSAGQAGKVVVTAFAE